MFWRVLDYRNNNTDDNNNNNNNNYYYYYKDPAKEIECIWFVKT